MNCLEYERGTRLSAFQDERQVGIPPYPQVVDCYRVTDAESKKLIFQTFLGFANFYWHFIYNFSAIVL